MDLESMQFYHERRNFRKRNFQKIIINYQFNKSCSRRNLHFLFYIAFTKIFLTIFHPKSILNRFYNKLKENFII